MSVSPQLTSSPSSLRHPYLWIIGHFVHGQAIAQLPTGTLVGDRFKVIAPHVWKDTQPDSPLERDMAMPFQVTPYLKLYSHRLHIPEVYGVLQPERLGDSMLLLLANVPVDSAGNQLPSIATAWEAAHPTRQLNWLWQMGHLWSMLDTEGVAASLLVPENIRVEGWRIRLRELWFDGAPTSSEPPTQPVLGVPSSSLRTLSLKSLGHLWMTWSETAHPSIRDGIRAIAQALQQPEITWNEIAPALNTMLLRHAAQMPFKLDIAGGTSPGAETSSSPSPNEDACYPVTLSVNGSPVDESDGLSPRVAIVCDGIGGHAGGEVASHLAIRTLKLQLRALFEDLALENAPLPPDIVMRQIEAAIRVVNNLVAFQNNEQGREARQRMGTTLVMAIQIPHQIETPSGTANTHEIYIAQVGDSRAYWLTPTYCQCLTVDDDVKTREIIAGRSLPREAARRADTIALTQALGTRSGEYLHLKLQRFIVEEDGVMLLCSDGLSDSQMIERHWQSMANHVLHGKLPLNKAVGIWLKLAEQHHGKDNASVVLMRCRVSRTSLDLFDPLTPAQPTRQRSIQKQPAQKSERSNTEKAGGKAKRSPSHSPVSPTAAAPRQRKAASAKTPPPQPAAMPPSPSAKSDSDVLSTVEFRHVNADFSPAPSSNRSAKPKSSAEHAHLPDRPSDSSDELEQLAKTLLESEAHRADMEETERPGDDEPSWNIFAVAVGLSVVMFITGAAGVFAWRQFAPDAFNEHVQEAMDRLSKQFLEIVPSKSQGVED